MGSGSGFSRGSGFGFEQELPAHGAQVEDFENGTKMIPNDVDEYAAMRLSLITPSENKISETIVPTNPR